MDTYYYPKPVNMEIVPGCIMYFYWDRGLYVKLIKKGTRKELCIRNYTFCDNDGDMHLILYGIFQEFLMSTINPTLRLGGKKPNYDLVSPVCYSEPAKQMIIRANLNESYRAMSFDDIDSICKTADAMEYIFNWKVHFANDGASRVKDYGEMYKRLGIDHYTIRCHHNPEDLCTCNVRYIEALVIDTLNRAPSYFTTISNAANWFRTMILVTEIIGLVQPATENLAIYEAKILNSIDLRQYILDMYPEFAPMRKCFKTADLLDHGVRSVIGNFITKSKKISESEFASGSGMSLTEFKKQCVHKIYKNCTKIHLALMNFKTHAAQLKIRNADISEFVELNTKVNTIISKALHEDILIVPVIIDILQKLNKINDIIECRYDTSFEISELFKLKTFSQYASTCLICSNDTILIDMNCCDNSLCFECLIKILKIPSKGYIDLFPKCSFCRKELDSEMLAHANMDTVYHNMMTHVIDINYSEIRKAATDNYFSICYKCKDAFGVPKICSMNIEMLPSVCRKCDNATDCKQCPVCEIWVYRIDGCNDMKCICGNHFCWLCCVPIVNHDRNHFRYDNGFFGKRCINYNGYEDEYEG
jgi:hypothetical protein